MGLFEFFDWLWVVATVAWAGAPVALIALAVWAARVARRKARLLRRLSRELAVVEGWPPVTSRAAHAEALHRLANAMRRGGEDR
jgi:hypothetical protein